MDNELNVAEIKAKSKKSLKWSLLAEIFAKISTPLATMVLARLLTPEIFGITTTVALVVSFCEAVAETGFSKFIIQQEFENDDQYKKYLSVGAISSVAVSFILFLLIFIFRFQISSFVGNEGYENILIVSCTQIPFTAINSILISNLKRDFKFNSIFAIRVLYCIVPFAITIPLAFFGFNEWALVIGTIAGQLIQTPFLLFFSRKEIKVHFSFHVLKDMLSKSFVMIIESIIIWACSWTATFVATQFFDKATVGVVKVANSTITSIFSIFNTGFVAVLFSSLSRLQNNDDEFQQSFFSLQSIAFVLMVPLSIGCFFFSDTVTDIFLGDKWEAAKKVIAVLGLTKFLHTCFNNFVSEVFRSKGHFYSSIIYQLVILGLDLALKFTIGKISFDLFVWSTAITNVLVSVMAILILKIRYKFSILRQIKFMLPAFVCSLTMLPILLIHYFGSFNMIESLIQISISVVIYFTFGTIFFNKLFSNAFSYLGLNKIASLSANLKSSKITKFSKKVFSFKHNKKCTLNYALTFFSFSCLIISGFFTSSATIENASLSITDLTTTQTNDKEYSCALIEGKDEEHKTNTSVQEYRYWYNTFNGGSEKSRNAFFGVVNGNKELDCNFNDYDFKDPITFIFSEVNNNHSYHDHWIHEYYHLELMFETDLNVSSTNSFSFCYLTQTQAKIILGDPEPTEDEYHDLIGRTVDIKMSGDVYRWHIANIILECNDVNDCLTKLFGNWLLAGYKYPDNYAKKHCYVFNKYEYQNNFKLKYIKNNYINSHYQVELGKYNLNNPSIDFDFYSQTHFNNAYLLICLALILIFICLQALSFVILLKKSYLDTFSYIWIVVFSLLPFVIFKLIFRFSHALILFSYQGLVFYFVGFLLLVISPVLFLLFKNGEETNEKISF